MKKSEQGKRCKEIREEESAGKGGGCWDEGCSREIQMHLKPKSAEVMVGKREANREGDMLPGKNQLVSGKSAEMERWIDGGIAERIKVKRQEGEWIIE